MKFLRSKLALFFVSLFAFGSLAFASAYYGYNPATGLEVSHGADVSGGTSPVVTVTGSSCTITTLKGGAYAGSFVEAGGTSCTFTVTFPSAAPNGWVCTITDLTTPADGPAKQASTSTTACVTGATTVVSNDVMQFTAVGY